MKNDTKIDFGKLIEYGTFESITLSKKSKPGDGKHGGGVKGDITILLPW